MINLFYEAAAGLPFCRELSASLKNGRMPASVTGLSAVHKAHTVLYLAQSANILVVCDDEAGALKMTEDINAMADEEIAVLFPVKDYAFANIETASPEYEHKRIRALTRIISKQSKVLICSAEAAMQPTIPLDVLEENTLTVKPDDEIVVREFASRLVSLGYTRAAQTEGRGQFSIRGDIIDVFPVNAVMPLRIELWGDVVDTVSYFDIESQRRIDTVKSAIIAPAKELLISKDDLAEAIEVLINRASGKLKDQIKKNLYSDLDH
ncbi:MAG: transcription-repair coupling factor, partial [Oscillospiraceae bacterium]|nr:transcription-repair coupling factor [Oscillospiraceae bacterium]